MNKTSSARLLNLLPAILLAIPGAAQAPAREEATPSQIAVSPSRFELTLDKGTANGALRVFNLGHEAVQVRVALATWDLDEDNQVRIVEPDEQSLETWMVVNPLRFTLPAGESQTVRFAVRPRVEPAPGEHRAMIYLEQEPPAAEPGKLRVRFRFGVAVYAYAGEPERDGELTGATITPDSNPPAGALTVASRGNAHVRLEGRWALWPAEAVPEGEGQAVVPERETAEEASSAAPLEAGNLPTTPVLPGTVRNLPLGLSRALPAGDYVLAVQGNLSGKALERRIRFTISGPEELPVAVSGVPAPAEEAPADETRADETRADGAQADEAQADEAQVKHGGPGAETDG